MSIPFRLAVFVTALAPAAAALAQPLVYGHRGASAYRPEHTLASYELAIDQGADYVEPDLVSTRDGVLVARHENDITSTTNVGTRPEFAARRTTKTVDGVRYTGWFTEDFTLAELKTLRAEERIPGTRPGSAAYDGRYQVPTFQEVIDLVKRKEAETGRSIGIIPETKHPSYFKGIGLPLERPLVEALAANGYAGPDARAIIQSFEVGNLIELNALTDVRLVQLTTSAAARPWDFVVSGDRRTYGDLLTAAGLSFVAGYADIVGPDKGLVIPRLANGTLGTATGLVDRAHAAGLQVVPYTFRPENSFLPPALRNGTDPNAYGNDAEEFRRFLEAGVDGLFADAPDRARAAVNAYLAAQAAVPEPATRASTVAGVGLLGGTLRRRRASPPALA